MNIIKYNKSKDSNNSNVVGASSGISGASASITSQELLANLEQRIQWKQGNAPYSIVTKYGDNVTEGESSVGIGVNTHTTNIGEFAMGTFNDSTVDETIFSIGDGVDDDHRHNIFEIKNNGNIITAGDISAVDGTFSGNLSITGDAQAQKIIATNGEISYLVTDTNNTKNLNVSVKAIIKELLAEDITVDNLTVNKAAHFFKLIIDEVKASKGQIIITPSNATLDYVEPYSGFYRCYFRASDADGKQIINSFEVGDQVLCQTFNAAQGTSYNVSNKFYWRLCTNVSSTVLPKTINGQTQNYWYIDLSNIDKDTNTNGIPEIGDEVVILGNRSDTTRQAAIVISAYNNTYLDGEVNAPAIVQYDGINNYNLRSHRINIISKGLNSFKGTFVTSTGDNIEDLIDNIDVDNTYVHMAWANSSNGYVDFTKVNNSGDYEYIGFKSDTNPSDASLIYSDYTWNRIKGSDGTSFTSKGTAIGHYANFTKLEEAIQTVYPDENDEFIIDTSEDYYESEGGTEQTGYDAPTIMRFINAPDFTWGPIEATVGDGYMVNGHLFVANEENWADMGQIQGVNGEDAEFYRLSPIRENAIVTLNKNGTLAIYLTYNILHIVGSSISQVNATSNGYHISFTTDTSSTVYNLSVNTTTPSYSQSTFMANYHTAASKPTYLIVNLYNGSELLDTRTVNVIFNADALLSVNAEMNNISATVSGHTNDLIGMSSSISNLTINYNNISSTVSTIQNDYVTSSQLLQTANNIQLNVYNELNQKTGINVTNGTITLDATYTTINGNLNLYNHNNNGLTIFDDNNIERVNIQAKDIGNIAELPVDYYHTHQYVILREESTTFNKTVGDISVGSVEANSFFDLNTFGMIIGVVSPDTEIMPASNRCRLIVNMIKDNTIVATKTVELIHSVSNIYRNFDDNLRFSITEAGTYSFRFTISDFTDTLPSGYTVLWNVGATFQGAKEIMTYIGQDGMYSHVGANKLFWLNKDMFQWQYGVCGLRLLQASDNQTNGGLTGRIETITGISGNYPYPKMTWLPFHNYTPTFRARDYTQKTITNTGETKWAYTIDPKNDCGICIVTSHQYDTDTWIELPPTFWYNEAGETERLPVGYTITIIRNFAFGEGTLYVAPYSFRGAGKAAIVDANMNNNMYVGMNDNNTTRETFIYVETYYGFTEGPAWVSVHDH